MFNKESVMDDFDLSMANQASGRRTLLVQILNKQLADTIDLRSQTRQAHFNVKGPYVRELRSLFDGLAQDLRRFADFIAQRVNTLGGHAGATVRFVANESGLREYPLDAVDAHDHLQALLSSYSRYELDTWHNVRTAKDAGDRETAALLESISDWIERNLWFLEVNLELLAVGLHGGKLPEWTSSFESPHLSAMKAKHSPQRRGER
jgi:starvation-inducible DNA-binding protein